MIAFGFKNAGYTALLTPQGPPAGYAGALPGEYVPVTGSGYKTLATGDWIAANVGTGGVSKGDTILYMQPTGSGTVTLHCYGKGFKLACPTDTGSDKGTFTLSINGGAAITVNQHVANPDGSNNSWYYYTSPAASANQLFTVVLTFSPQSSVYPVYDGYLVY